MVDDPIPRTVEWVDGGVRLIDQRELPGHLVFLDCATVDELCEAISSLAVRGAPALGATGGYGIALACRLAAEREREGSVAGSGGATEHRDGEPNGRGGPVEAAVAAVRAARKAAEQIIATRPTAVNLAWGVRRVLAAAEAAAGGAPVGGASVGGAPAGGVAAVASGGGLASGSAVGASGGGAASGAAAARRVGADGVFRAALEEAERLAAQDVADNRALGRHGAALVPEGAQVLTHCNAGALACVGYGTALGVIRAAAEAGKKPRVWVDETRPVLQGARLTAWELDRLGIEATLVADVMAGSLMASDDVDLIVVGADRVAANGDVANKIGTYSLAVLAAHHGVPFYVAAPTSTIDLATATGADIPVEERSPDEVLRVGGSDLAPPGMAALNRAFDVTPAALVTAIITELGVAHPPYDRSLRRLVEAAPHRLPLRPESADDPPPSRPG